MHAINEAFGRYVEQNENGYWDVIMNRETDNVIVLDVYTGEHVTRLESDAWSENDHNRLECDHPAGMIISVETAERIGLECGDRGE